ncbi:MAG: L,D-transpeptidase family protein [Trichocoleus desertorum ATA4-8-CV12]|jgi:lipoprotein-anchoring transpeptidase ErfK/SrfK|nr:L,D-transpeptidase family protein [Trichocoleus desertorum ATA4-8-CV12]
MIKQALTLVSLFWACGLYLSTQTPLVSEPNILPADPAPSTTPQPTPAPLQARVALQASDDLDTGDLDSEASNVGSLSTQTATPTAQVAIGSIDQPLRLEIQRSRRRVTLYQGKTPIKTYPIAVGRQGWETPIGQFKVIRKLRNPTWINPLTDESISGNDPENPLGGYWIGFWTDGRNWIGFHATPNPESVGQPVSHGCIRMHKKDIQEFFNQVQPGTPVIVKG